MKTEKHFPTIIGLIFLVACVAVGVYLTLSTTSLGSKASGSCQPTNPQVTNITHNSADISFVTSAACSPALMVDNRLFEDVKSSNNSSTQRKIHYFQIKYLRESTDYSYSIINSNQTLTNDQYHFKTSAQPTSSLPVSNLAWGRVLNPDLKTAGIAIVYLNIPNAAPLSSFVTTDGNWSISLASSFNEQKTDWFTPPVDSVSEDITVISEDGTATQVTNQTSANNPVSDIIIGQNSLSSSSTAVQTGDIGKISPASIDKSLDIINPKNGDSLPANRPDFFGSAPKNSQIIIEVHSSIAYNGEVQSDSTGSWHWSPPENLSPGEHSITVKVKNPLTGVWETVTRNFTVLASDNSSPAYTASNSASIITPTSVPTVEPTLKPTAIVASTSTPISLTTVTPTVTTPVTGNFSSTLTILVIALIFVTISFKLIF